MHGTATFTANDDGARRALSVIAGLGFATSPAEHVVVTVLDSFDGRLHREGLRLEWRESAAPTLVLSALAARRSNTAQVAMASMPRLATDLPPGPMRSRIAEITDIRALLPVLRLTMTATNASLTDELDRSIVQATLREGLQVAGHPDATVPWTITVQPMIGSERDAARVAEALRAAGALQLDGDTITIAARASGIDERGWSGSPTVPLDPWMPAADGVRLVLANLAEAIAANRSGTIERTDPEFLHDLRVAVRRTRTILGRAKRVLPADVLDRAGARFAWWGSATGPGRDLDVHLLELDRTIAAAGDPGGGDPGGDPVGGEDPATVYAPMRALLVERRDAAYDNLAGILRAPDTVDQLASWRRWLDGPMDRPGGVDADAPVLRPVTTWIRHAHSRIIEHGRSIHPDSPAEQLHDLRKDAKRLRYLLECYGSLLAKDARKPFVARLRDLQDNLGEHQDAGVQVGELQAIAHEVHRRGAPAATLVAIGRLAEQADGRRAAARAEFAERFAEFDAPPVRQLVRTVLDGPAS